MAAFPDHFSGRASEYARFRPRYPARLFDYLARLSPDRHRAWDCATGNGQAALGLARQFGSVVASDASPRQLLRILVHRPEIVFGVLEIVLRGNPVASQRFRVSQRQIAFIVSLRVLRALRLGAGGTRCPLLRAGSK